MSSNLASGGHNPIRYSDVSAELWMWSGAPLAWKNKVKIEFRNVSFGELCPAGGLKHWDVMSYWAKEFACRHSVPPLVVNQTENGMYYVQDGNHRLEALRVCFRNRIGRLQVRVAVLVPKRGYHFTCRQFRTHWTYVLEAEHAPTEASVNDFLGFPLPPTGVESEVLHG